VFDRPTRREFSTLALVILAACPASSFAQDEPKAKAREKAEPPAAATSLPSPEPVPDVTLLPTLPTTKVRRGAPEFNLQMVDASLLPRDKQGIWVLDFTFKPLRMYTVEIPGKGRRLVHYLYYRIVNRTGAPRELVPQFTLITDTGKRYEESVLPKGVRIIQAREDRSIRLLGAVDIAGVIPPSTKEGIDDAIYGVAMWEGVDPHADRMSIYVRGLSNGFHDVAPPDGGKPVTKYKTLRIDLIRRGDARNLNEKEITLAEPSYEWIYW
jgi:hypothetical protein